MKTGFSLLGKTYRENPVFITGMGLQCECCFWPELSKPQTVSMEDGGVDRDVRLSFFFSKQPSWKTTFINAYPEDAFIYCGLVQLQSSVRWSKTSLIVISRKDRPSKTSKANNILEFRSFDMAVTWSWEDENFWIPLKHLHCSVIIGRNPIEAYANTALW